MRHILPLFRSRLFSLLSSSATLIVIHGNRFAGKTTLVRTWLMADPVSAAVPVFVEAPPTDVTKDDYWSAVLRAVCAYLGSAPPDHCGDGFEEVRSFLVAQHRPIVLILDGIGAVESAEEHVGDLLARCPRLRVVVTTRVAGQWCRYVDSVPGRLMLTSDALAFTDGEVRAFLRASAVPHGSRVVRRIVRRTGGAPALIAAVCEVLKADSAQVPDGEDRIDHLVDTAVDTAILRAIAVDPVVASRFRSVLMSAAIATPLALSAGVLPSVVDPVEFVDALESAGMVESEPGTDLSMRTYPDAVRESLLRSAEAECSDELRDARTALIRFWLEHSNAHNALVHAVESGNWECAVTIVEEHWATLYSGGFLLTLSEALVNRIPVGVAERNPTVAAIRRLHRRLTEPRDIPVSIGEREHPPAFLPEPAATLMRAIDLRLGGHFAEAAAACEDFAGELVRASDDPDVARRNASALDHLHVGFTYLLAGRIDDAPVLFRLAHRLGGDTFVERTAAGVLALTHALRGSITEARLWIDEEHRHGPLPADEEMIVRPPGLVASALVALDRLDPDGAFDILTELGSPDDNEECWAFTLYANGQHALLAGLPADGLQYIESEIQRFSRLYGGMSGHLLDAVRADLNLAIGRPDEARRVVARSTDTLTAAARARICLFTGDPVGAEAIGHHYRDDPSCPPRVSMELAVVGAAAACSLGRRNDARRCMFRAVALSRQTGMLRPFTGLAPSMVRNITDLGVDLPVDLEQIALDFGTFRTTQPMVRLTPREAAVLEALVAGGNAGTIAEAQFVSLNTVKTQLRSLYRKLGVHSRRDAIAVARRLVLD
ncbi:LuxR C-terminal-related transcriptional regulator [Rhodococcus sp. SJ-2]